MRKPSVLQINAVVLAVALTGCYVWFRTAQAQQHRDQVMPGSKMRPLTVQRLAATTQSSPVQAATAPAVQAATAPATTSKAVFYGTKSLVIDLTRSPTSAAPTTQPAP